VKEIILTQGYSTIVDDDDYDLLNSWRWKVYKSSKTCYAFRNIKENGKFKCLHMSRVILNPPKNYVVDHINGNGLDNRRCNLRVVTHRQNHQNLHINKNNGSKYPGVSYHKAGNAWQARIAINGKEIYLGLAKSEYEAFLIYKIANIAIGEKVIEPTF